MYRDRLLELQKEKGISTRAWSEQSGVSVDTIGRITNPVNPDKDSPRVNTLEDLCKVLGVELWELFYIGDHSLVAMQAEIATLRAERDELLIQKAVLADRETTLLNEVDSLKNDVIKTQKLLIELFSTDRKTGTKQ